MYVDFGLLSLTVPLLDHGRKLLPVTLFVIFFPIPMFEAFMILIFSYKWSADTDKVLSPNTCVLTMERNQSPFS